MWSASFMTKLEIWGADPDLCETRFIARNYLLDERPSSQRIAAYDMLNPGALEDCDAWWALHEHYLNKHARGRPAAGLRPVLLRSDAPDTFVIDPQFTPYSHSSHDLELIRVMRADTLARLSTRSPTEVLQAIGDDAAMEGVLEDANERLDTRPTFAAFFEDVADLLPSDLEAAPQDWADQLRDVLGLWPVNPPPGTSIPIIVFRYPIGDVVRLQGMGTDRPLTVPTVLDIDQFEAFCPAPLTIPVGQLVNLEGALVRDPAGEVLHPAMALSAPHVFRLGHVSRPPRPLDRARGAHLTWLQVETSSDFGAGIDDDVLAL